MTIVDSQESQALLDHEHLRLLRFGFLVTGWFNAAMALFPLIHITLGILLLSGVFPQSGKANEPEPRFIGLFFLIIGCTLSTIFATLGILKLVAARRIRERRSKLLIMVVAGISCLEIPYGTALGVCTFLVLQRPSVDAMFR